MDKIKLKRIFSEEHRRNISLARKGKPSYIRTPEHRNLMSKLKTGRIVSQEARQKISESLKGNPKLLGNQYWKKRNHLLMKQHIKEAMQNPDVRRKLSIASKKAWQSPDIRIKYIKSMTGRKLSEETKKKMSFRIGSKSPRWIDGRSYIDYPFEFKKIKKSKIIHKRDNYTCQLCNERILKNTYQKFLTLHHIDYNKKNNSENNLIALCNFCNISANKNRNEWIEYFHTKLGGGEVGCQKL